MKARALISNLLGAIFAVLVVCATDAPSQAAPDDRRIDQTRAATIKAAYLSHLAALTTWPDGVLVTASAPIRIVVLGADPLDLAGILTENTRRTRVGERALQVIHLPRCPAAGDPEIASILGRCQILFVTEAAEKDFPLIAPDLRNAPVLTVGETEYFPEDSGGMIGFFVRQGRVMIKARKALAEESGLKLSAEFLQHAVLVPSEKGGR